MIYQLVMNDYGTKVIIGYFETEKAAFETLGSIKMIKPETSPMDETVKMRCFKIGETRYIDQNAVYSVESITVTQEQLPVTPMSLNNYLTEEAAASYKPALNLKDVDLSDLC